MTAVKYFGSGTSKIFLNANKYCHVRTLRFFMVRCGPHHNILITSLWLAEIETVEVARAVSRPFIPQVWRAWWKKWRLQERVLHLLLVKGLLSLWGLALYLLLIKSAKTEWCSSYLDSRWNYDISWTLARGKLYCGRIVKVLNFSKWQSGWLELCILILEM